MDTKNPNDRSRGKKTYQLHGSSGEVPRFSSALRSMQRPRVVQRLKVEGGGGAPRLGHRKDEEEMKRHEGGKGERNPPDPIYKTNG